MPTNGKESEFVIKMGNLCVILDKIKSKYDSPAIFIQRDCNVSKSNLHRVQLFDKMVKEYDLFCVPIQHPTYHHFTGNGLYDSHLDIIAFSSSYKNVGETIDHIICSLTQPEMSSHHDILISTMKIGQTSPSSQAQQVSDAPRIEHTSRIIHWTDEGIEDYQNLVADHMQALCEHFSESRSHTMTSLLIQYTNDLLVNAARCTNPSSEPQTKKTHKRSFIPRCVVKAKRKLAIKLKNFHNRPSFNAFKFLKDAQKGYKKAVKRYRINKLMERDAKIDRILSSHPSSIYSY